MQDFGIFSSEIDFFFNITLKIPRKNIISFIDFTLTIVYPIIVLKLLLNPMNLPEA